MTLRVFAHGGGVQSTAALVLSAQGKIDFPIHLFANVGDDSENPATLRYMRLFSGPYAAAHGITLEMIRRIKRDGTMPTLLEDTLEPSRSIGIPVRMGTNGAPGTRRCTHQYKTAPITKRVRELGATKESPAVIGIGFSTDEVERIGRVTERTFERREFPLVDLGLSRADCLEVIRLADLPEPPKSSCWFCPFHRPVVWAEMARDNPDLFAKAAQLETDLNARRVQIGRDHVYLTRFGKPLREAIQPAQATLFGPGSGYDGETCDEGVCFT